jgi:hypothetical protein
MLKVMDSMTASVESSVASSNRETTRNTRKCGVFFLAYARCEKEERPGAGMS